MSNFVIHGDGEVVVSPSAQISPDVQFVFHTPSRVTIGDYCIIGPGVKFVCSGGDVALGEWTTLHDRCLVLSTEGVDIGAHCWFGQNTVIDGSGGITIGRGVRVGMYSQLWSHVAAGEQIEGCTLFGKRPVVIEDDVWLVGSCIVASGVTIGKRSVALIASNITKSCAANSVLAGSPAAPKTNLSFYKEVTLDEKWQMLVEWVNEIAREINVRVDISSNSIQLLGEQSYLGERMIFAKESERAAAMRLEHPDSTVCCVQDKSYNARFSKIEHSVLKSLSGNKARFYNLPKVGLN